MFYLNDKTFDRIFKQIRDNKPDLVIFTGDCIQSKFQQIDAIQFAEWMEKIGVYWAYVFGNHEAREEKSYYKYLIFKSLVDYPHCLSKFGNKDLFGYGNFIINIMNSDTELKHSLFFFDSGRDVIESHALNDNVPLEYVNSYDYIKPSQIRWYENELKSLSNTYGEVKNSLYMHIPIPEYKQIKANEKTISAFLSMLLILFILCKYKNINLTILNHLNFFFLFLFDF